MSGRGGQKYNRYFGRGGGNKNRGGGGRGGGRERWQGHHAKKGSAVPIAIPREPRDNRDDFSVHGGSFKLSDIQKDPLWQSRVTQPEHAPKRKYALCIGYLGTEYQGLQINPGAITIEAILEKALFLSGAIDEKNFGNIQKVAWSRTARTDKVILVYYFLNRI